MQDMELHREPDSVAGRRLTNAGRLMVIAGSVSTLAGVVFGGVEAVVAVVEGVKQVEWLPVKAVTVEIAASIGTVVVGTFTQAAGRLNVFRRNHGEPSE